MTLTVVATLVVFAGQCARDDPGATRRPTNPDPEQTAAAPEFKFVDVAGSIDELAAPTRTWGGTFVDYNRDGLPDLLINRHLRKPIFLVNSPEGFDGLKLEALKAPAPGRRYYDRHGCAWGEANGDRLPDLYCVSGAQKGEGTGPKQLLIQQRDGTLVDRADRYGVVDLYGRGRSVNWIDFNLDGRLDIFVGNELRAGYGNVLFARGASGFDPAVAGLEEEIATTSSSWADWDGDGDSDVLVLTHGTLGAIAYRNDDGSYSKTTLDGITGGIWNSAAWGDYDGDGFNDVAVFSPAEVAILHNDGGSFSVEQRLRLQEGRTGAWLDADNNGALDLFVVQGRSDGLNRPDFLLAQRDGSFGRTPGTGLRGPTDGDGDAVLTADFDRDGRMDLAVTNGYRLTWGSVDLFANRSARHEALLLDLRDGPWNPFAFGARVHVQTSGLSYWREIGDGYTFEGQSEVNPLHLGLGTASSAQVRVVWPDGSRDCLEVESGGVVEVVRGANPCPG